MTSVTSNLAENHVHNHDTFDRIATVVREHFDRLWESRQPAAQRLFTTDAEGLFQAYLDGFETPEERQHHNCHACRRFIETFGGLVFIDPETGATHPAFWAYGGFGDPLYGAPIHNMREIVAGARVTGVFATEEKRWGIPVTGDWHHFAVTPPAALVHKDRMKTAYQVAAEKKEDYGIVCRSLAEFDQKTVDTAVTLLESEALYRSEKVAGPGRWFQQLHRTRAGTQNTRHRENLTWLAVATAPPGFAHIRSAMIGTLLEDIAAGMDFADVSKRFAAKMNPLQYQRPQAAPTRGNIEQAEKIIEKMGIAASLRRRFARLEDVIQYAIWTPKAAEQPQGGGVFGHLKAKGEKPVASSLQIPATNMTWDKFARTVLPGAQEIRFHTGAGHARSSYFGLVTAVDPDAPPILQWDREEARNPVSWYHYSSGSSANDWSLPFNAWVTVNAILPKPPHFHGEGFDHQGKAALLLLDGAKDRRDAHLCLFPEILRSELREIRATIEAHSQSQRLEGADLQSANGVAISAGNRHGDATYLLRVITPTSTADYRIDRWD